MSPFELEQLDSPKWTTTRVIPSRTFRFLQKNMMLAPTTSFYNCQTFALQVTHKQQARVTVLLQKKDFL